MPRFLPADREVICQVLRRKLPDEAEIERRLKELSAYLFLVSAIEVLMYLSENYRGIMFNQPIRLQLAEWLPSH